MQLVRLRKKVLTCSWTVVGREVRVQRVIAEPAAPRACAEHPALMVDDLDLLHAALLGALVLEPHLEQSSRWRNGRGL